MDGRAYAWGRCVCGRREASAGQPVSGSSVVPYMLEGGGIEREYLVQVAAGYTHLLLLTRGGILFSCESSDDGYGGRLQTAPSLNSFGQLGRPGPPLAPLLVPTHAIGQEGLTAVAAGRCSSYAKDSRGRVFSWGCAQASGQLVAETVSPALVPGLTGA